MSTQKHATRCPNGQCYDSRAVALQRENKGLYLSSICEHVGTDGRITCKLTGTELVRVQNKTPKQAAVDIWINRPDSCPFEESPATPLQWSGLKGDSKP